MHEIEIRRLVRVLSDWGVGRTEIRVASHSKRHHSPRVRLFVDALVAAARNDERFVAGDGESVGAHGFK